MQCKLNQIRTYGIGGIRNALTNVPMTFQKKPPGPSMDDINRAIEPIVGWLGKVLGTQFKLYLKAFKIYYKPHFKVLNMLEKSFDQYWDGIQFLSWSLDLLIQLEQKTESYLKATGLYDFQKYMGYFSALSDSEYNVALKNFRLSAAVMAEFDSELFGDIRELLIPLNKGLEEILRLPPAQTISDRIALRRLLTDLDMGYVSSTVSKLTSTVDGLRTHFDSWRTVEGANRMPFPSIRSELIHLQGKYESVMTQVRQLGNFGG